MMNDWKIVIQHLVGRINMGIWIIKEINGRTQFLCKDGGTYTQEMGDSVPDPILELSPELLQELANKLAKTGFKPLEGRVEGELEATKKHLIDLRQLLKLK